MWPPSSSSSAGVVVVGAAGAAAAIPARLVFDVPDGGAAMRLSMRDALSPLCTYILRRAI